MNLQCHGCRNGRRTPGTRAACAAFTLAEVLAALLFLALVVPVVLEGLQVASMAGQAGQREATAYRIGERVLNEYLTVAASGSSSASAGTILEGVHEYRWSLTTATWDQDTMQQVSVVVRFSVQDRERQVRLSTLTASTYP